MSVDVAAGRRPAEPAHPRTQFPASAHITRAPQPDLRRREATRVRPKRDAALSQAYRPKPSARCSQRSLIEFSGRGLRPQDDESALRASSRVRATAVAPACRRLRVATVGQLTRVPLAGRMIEPPRRCASRRRRRRRSCVGQRSGQGGLMRSRRIWDRASGSRRRRSR